MNPPNQVERSRLVSRLARILLTVGLVVAVLSGLVPPTPPVSAQPEPSSTPLPPAEPVTRAVVTPPAGEEEPASLQLTVVDETALAASAPSPASVAAAGDPYWEIETVDGTPGAGYYASLASGAGGSLHVSYYRQGSGDLRYALFDSSSWITDTVDSLGDVGQYSSLALDSAGNPRISYKDFGYGIGKLRYAQFTGTDWITETVHNFSDDAGSYSSLALDLADNPHITYLDIRAFETLGYAYHDGTWHYDNTADDTGRVGGCISLALADDLHPRISYYDMVNDALLYAALDGTWSVAEVNGPGGGGLYTSLALDAANQPHISYYAQSTGQLMYAHLAGSTWISETVAAVAGTQVHTSLALDASGRPHIAYYDELNYNLGYATLDGADWTIQTVDSSAGVGGYPSLALDANGYAHIAYYHYIDGLKHAWMQPCAPAEILDVNGPRTMILGTMNTFTATVSPPTATVPLHFVWHPPGLDQVGGEVDSTESVVSIMASITGTHPLTVTVSGCGGVLETVRQVTIEEVPLPDLVVTDLWQDGGAIWYQITNTGPVPAPADHVSLLTIDGTRVSEDGIKVELAPGETMNRSFPYAYACTGNEDTLRVDVDAGRWFDELDETNNSRVESWFCDQEPPVISDVQFSASYTETTIVWATDDPGDSLVEYSPVAGKYDAFESDPAYSLDHKIGLTGLSPSTTYHFRVKSTDPNGLQSVSRDYYFETLAVAAAAPPGPATMVAPITGNADVYAIRANYADTRNIERVEFYLDGKLIDTDYAEGETEGEYEGIITPHVLGLTREEFYSPAHRLETMARGFDGGIHIKEEILDLVHTSPPTEVEITFPPPEMTIYVDGDAVPAGKRIDFTVFAAEYDFQCDWIPVAGSMIMEPDCEDVQQPVEMVQFLVDNKVEHTSYPTNDNDLWHHFTLELGGFTGAQKTVVARAIDTLGGKHEAWSTIYIQKVVREPILDVAREVTREGTHFRVRLTVENKPEATGDAKVDRVTDNVAGFQIVPKETADYRVTSSYAYWIGSFARDNNIEIDLGVLPDDTVTLSPGDSIVVEYLMVPILYEDPFDFRIGGMGRGDIHVYYEEPSGDLEMRGFDRRLEFTLQSMVSDAIAEADYLLVTHPRNMTGTYGSNGLNSLLGAMAELATLKLGVLGYLETPDPRHLLDALVEPNGGWASRLHPAFSTEGGGYMLIVGETEIVPAWHIIGFAGDKEVRLSDQYYSAMGNGPPWINLGRVVGDSMAQLELPIRTSINVYQGAPGYGFDRSHALVASGVGNMRSIMIDEVDYAENTLQNQGLNVTKIHWKDYAGLGGYDHSFAQYDGLAAGDVILGDGTDELIVAEDLHNRIRVQDRNGSVIDWFIRDIEDGDALAAGDLNNDGTEEIVLADSSSDSIHVYAASGFELFWFPLNFSPGDRLAVGNILGDAAEEIVMADQDDHVYVLEWTGIVLKDFAFTFGEQDGLAVGDVNGDAMDEIVLRTETDRGGGYYTATVASYVAAGVQLSQTASFEITKVRDGDALSTGDIDGNGTDDILLGRNHYYVKILNQQGHNVRGGIPTELEPYDGLVAGRFSGGARDEILIADQDGRFYYPDVQFVDQGHNAYRAVAPDQDVLFFLGHGSPDSWGPGLLNYALPGYLTSAPHFPLGLGNTNPVVYGATCLSGNYQSGDDDNIAEAFLDSGAAVFIGAVENSSAGPTESSLEWFLDNWGNGEAVGKAWFDMERAKWQLKEQNGDGWDFLVHEYNLYGDPKFGGLPAAPDARSVAQRAAQVPPAGFRIDVPAYQVDAGTDGYDRVTIPGGQLAVEAGAYQIPYWTHTIEITKGYRIEDLVLVKRAEPVPDEDLNLPVTLDEIWQGASAMAAVTALPVLDPDDSWVPSLDQEFTWQAVDNADGTTTLIVKVYPFYYQPLTGNALFYQGYDFDVTSISTPVTVEELSTSQVAYPEGDAVPVDLIVENAGVAQEVIVDATIWRNSGGELVDGLLLRTLHRLSGLASFALEWDSAGEPPGEYYVEVKLYDSDSNLLDQDSLTFRLGIMSGEITSLQATPEFFAVGETVDISMVFDNIGTLPITGTAVIEVQTAAGLAVTGAFTRTVEGLAAGLSVELHEAWDTTGVALGDYRVIGYVLYDARSTGVSTVTLTNARHVYLPLVLRRY